MWELEIESMYATAATNARQPTASATRLVVPLSRSPFMRLLSSKKPVWNRRL